MLEVGNGGMAYQEYRGHFSIWALMKVFLSLMSTFFLVYFVVLDTYWLDGDCGMGLCTGL